MRFYKRLNCYKNSSGTLVYYPETGKSYSYDWYLLSDRVKGITVLNTYNYSNTTNRHRYFMQRSLGHVDLAIEAPRGLQNLDATLAHYKGMIEELEQAIKRPRSRAKTNEQRRAKIDKYKATLDTIKRLYA